MTLFLTSVFGLALSKDGGIFFSEVNMARKKSQSEIAGMTGVTQKTVSNLERKHGGSEEDIIEAAKQSAKRTKEAKERFKTVNSKIKSKVRRIDLKSGSSIEDMLQDTKEQYVQTQTLIERLQHEIDENEYLMGGTTSGNFQILPHVNTLERYIKVAIQLRNQIAALENLNGTSEEDTDPFS